MGNNSNNTKQAITFKMKEGTFFVFPPDRGRMCVKAERTAKGQLTSIGYYDIEKKNWFTAKGMNIPYGIKCVIEEKYSLT